MAAPAHRIPAQVIKGIGYEEFYFDSKYFRRWVAYGKKSKRKGRELKR
jgi:hypothetical protein